MPYIVVVIFTLAKIDEFKERKTHTQLTSSRFAVFF